MTCHSEGAVDRVGRRLYRDQATEESFYFNWRFLAAWSRYASLLDHQWLRMTISIPIRSHRAGEYYSRRSAGSRAWSCGIYSPHRDGQLPIRIHAADNIQVRADYHWS